MSVFNHSLFCEDSSMNRRTQFSPVCVVLRPTQVGWLCYHSVVLELNKHFHLLAGILLKSIKTSKATCDGNLRLWDILTEFMLKNQNP